VLKRIQTLVLFVFGVFSAVANCQTQIEESLLGAALSVFPDDVSEDEAMTLLQSGLWHDDPTAVAVSIPRGNECLTFIFLSQPDGTYSAADASWVSGAAFGFWGFPREEIERFEIEPLSWSINHHGNLMVRIRTRGWREGQRYTASGAYLVSPDGSVTGQ
jgi:hypothetical protein